jgi:hypothetical protein
MSEKKMNLTFDDYIFINDFFDKIQRSTSGFGFTPENAFSPGLPNKYNLPFIGISEEEPVNELFFDGFLGVYFHGGDKDISREGKIVLYRKNIEKIAFKLSLEERIDFNLANSLIFKIVLAHELSHWMFHYCPLNCDVDACNNQDSINRLYNKINRDLHEYIAQKMTRKVFEIHPLFEVVFNWLLSHQDEPYLFEMTEKINQIAAFKHLINCTVENNEIIQEALLAGEINYDCFKKLIEQKRGLISGKKYGL